MLAVLPLDTVPVLAASGVQTVRQIQITAEYDGKVLEGLPFSLYKIGSVDEEGTISLLEPYAAYPIDFSDTSAIDWAELSETIAGYIQLNQEMPFRQGETDENGMLYLQFDAVDGDPASLQVDEGTENETEIYLLMGQSLEKDGMLYTVSPALLSSADLDAAGQLKVCAKVSGKKSEPQELTVHKKWNGITDPAQKPASVEVTLLRNGSSFETVQLSEQNNWTYKWTELDGSFEWTCVETPVTGFHTAVSKSNSLIVITNTKIPGSKTKELLPYTGIDFRPFIAVFLFGCILIIVSLFLRRREGRVVGFLFGALFLTISIAGIASNELHMLKADRAKNAVLEEMEGKLEDTEAAGNIEDKGKIVDENGCVGIIQVPELGICMPVTENWDYDKLEWAACIYYGGPKDSSMVIAGHSYVTFFRSLRKAQEEQTVIFTDLSGKSTQYKVAEVEILQPEETERMVNSDWDLTLFTCTTGSTARCAVRCGKIV